MTTEALIEAAESELRNVRIAFLEEEAPAVARVVGYFDDETAFELGPIRKRQGRREFEVRGSFLGEAVSVTVPIVGDDDAFTAWYDWGYYLAQAGFDVYLDAAFEAAMERHFDREDAKAA